eukprot:6591762-Prymnesium_polylepis.1
MERRYKFHQLWYGHKERNVAQVTGGSPRTLARDLFAPADVLTVHNGKGTSQACFVVLAYYIPTTVKVIT